MSRETPADSPEPICSTLGVDPEFRQLVGIYIDSLRGQRGELRAMFDAGAFERLGRLAHQVKGSGGGYGFQGLTEIAAALEAACKARQLEMIQTELDRLDGYIDRMSV